MTNCLIIDDVAVSRFAVKLFLEEMNIDVYESEDAKTAIKYLESNSPDIIFLDWHLKKENGLDLIPIIREKHGKNVKIVVFSGVENNDKSSEVKSLGADSYMSKPTTQEKLQASLHELGFKVK